MFAWHFTEMPYPHLPPFEEMTTMRVSLSNAHYDPKIGAELYNRYLDEYIIASELGLNMLLNEHHQTATCLDVAVPLSASILARQTTKGRICILGNPVANRNDPIRIAEEMAMIDNISRGRLDVGYVRGVPYEIFAANTNPTQTVEKLWEGIDLTVLAWTKTEPFNFEGRFTHRRMVNLWPRPYQTPHPAIWITGSSDLDSIRKAAGRGYVFATFLQPYDKVRKMFDAYRSNFHDRGLPGGGGTAYMPLVYTADTEEEAEKGAKELTWYLAAPRPNPQYRNPPGYVPVETNVQALRGAYSGRTDAMRAQGIDFLKEQGVMIYGTPDSVAKQIKRFYDLVGGFDHLLMMQQAGHLDHARTVKSMTLFAKEVYPQIRDLARTQPLNSRAAAE